MEIVYISIVVLHFIIGFGWLYYKLEVEKDEKKNIND